MKIVMIGQKGIPTLFGGIERHVEEVACRLAQKKEFQVFVYARKYYTPKRVKKYKRVKIIHLPSIETKHFDTISHVFLASWHAVFKIRPDIFHYHGIGPALCLWIPKFFSPWSKVVFTFHCRDYFHQKWGGFARLSLKIGEILGCYLADEVIPTDLEVKKYIEGKYSRQVNFIPHGVNLEQYFFVEKIKKWGLRKNNYILAVSRLIPHKGIHYLIKAYQKIKTDKKLIIVGPSFYTQDYEKKLKKMANNNQNIIFLGGQKGKVLEELFANAYLFVHPSEQEGAPLVLTEAAGFGRALLLSDIPAHKNIFEDLPFFFKNKNTKDLKEKLEFLLAHPQLVRNRGRKIKEFSRKHYSWDKVVDELILRYGNL